MDKRFLVELIMVIFFVGVMVAFWVKGKKEWVLTIIYGLMVGAEALIGSKEGQKKLESVLDVYYYKVSKFPFFIRFVLNKIFTREKITKYIEALVPRMNGIFREKYINENNVVDRAIDFGKETLLNKALLSKYEGNENLVDNATLINLSKETGVGRIKAFAEVATDLKRTNIKAGIEALYKF